MIDDRFQGILELLREKSRKNQVEWMTDGQNSYSVDFPDGSRLVIDGDVPVHEPDWVSATLYGPDSAIVARATAEASSAQDEHDEFGFLDSIYQDAIRVAHKHDVVLKTVEDSLKADTPVGRAQTADVSPF